MMQLMRSWGVINRTSFADGTRNGSQQYCETQLRSNHNVVKNNTSIHIKTKYLEFWVSDSNTFWRTVSKCLQETFRDHKNDHGNHFVRQVKSVLPNSRNKSFLSKSSQLDILVTLNLTILVPRSRLTRSITRYLRLRFYLA